MESTALFAKTPPLKLFAIAALPGSVSMLASALYQLLDGAFVGRLLGETAFAALNLAMPFVIINFSLADLIGVGSSVHISVCLGRKNEREAYNIFTCACLMIVGAGVLVGGILFAAAPLLIGFMGAEGDFAAMAIQYMRVYALCSPLTTIIFAVDNYLRICGKIRMSMWLNILMSILTGLLEFTLLVVLDCGIWAAALASSLGMILCVLVALIPFARSCCHQYGNQLYIEDTPLLTDLFPLSLNQGKFNILFYRAGHILDQYLRLKERKANLVAERAYFGGNRSQLAWEYGRLLSYPDEAIRRLISDNPEKERL